MQHKKDPKVPEEGGCRMEHKR